MKTDAIEQKYETPGMENKREILHFHSFDLSQFIAYNTIFSPFLNFFFRIDFISKR